MQVWIESIGLMYRVYEVCLQNNGTLYHSTCLLQSTLRPHSQNFPIGVYTSQSSPEQSIFRFPAMPLTNLFLCRQLYQNGVFSAVIEFEERKIPGNQVWREGRLVDLENRKKYSEHQLDIGFLCCRCKPSARLLFACSRNCRQMTIWYSFHCSVFQKGKKN